MFGLELGECSKVVEGSMKGMPSQERCARRKEWVLLMRSFCHGSLAYVAAVLLEVFWLGFCFPGEERKEGRGDGDGGGVVQGIAFQI